MAIDNANINGVLDAHAGSCDGYVCVLLVAAVALPVLLAVPALVVPPARKEEQRIEEGYKVAAINGHEIIAFSSMSSSMKTFLLLFPVVWNTKKRCAGDPELRYLE